MGKGGQRRFSKVVWPGFRYTPPTRHAVKVGRNDPCPCGSKKKYKDCHEASGSAYLERLARDQEKVKMRELRERLRAQGVPWYKRLFVR